MTSFGAGAVPTPDHNPQPPAPPDGPFPGPSGGMPPPGYPPYQTGPAYSPFSRPGARMSALQPVSAVLLGLGGLLAILSSFLPTYSITLSPIGAGPNEPADLDSHFLVTPWSSALISHSGGTFGKADQWLGIALVVAGVVAIGSAVLALSTLNRPAPTARLLTVAGGAVLFGVTLTVITAMFSNVSRQAAESATLDALTTEPGASFWLAVVIAILGIGVVVLTTLSGGDPSSRSR